MENVNEWPEKMSFAEMQRMDLEHMQGIYRPIKIPGLPIPGTSMTEREEYTELTDDDLLDESHPIEIDTVEDSNMENVNEGKILDAVKMKALFPTKLSFAELQRRDLEHMLGIIRNPRFPEFNYVPEGVEYDLMDIPYLEDEDLFDENHPIEIVAKFDDNTPEEVYDFAEKYVSDIIANRKILESNDSGEDVSYNKGIVRAVVKNLKRKLNIPIYMAKSNTLRSSAFLVIINPSELPRYLSQGDIIRDELDVGDYGDKGYERMIIIDPGKLSSGHYKRFSAENVERTIMHEYGHYLTIPKLTNLDYVDNEVMFDIISLFSRIEINIDNKSSVDASLDREWMYHNYCKIEAVANKAAGVDIVKLIEAYTGRTPNGRACGYDLSIFAHNRSELIRLYGSGDKRYFSEILQHLIRIYSKLWNGDSNKLSKLQKFLSKYNTLKESNKEVINMNTEIIFEAANEPDVKDPEYNGNMTPAAAKRTLATATASVLQNKKVNQYTADIYANIITKNLLGTWIKGYRKLSITLDPKLKGSVFEFKIPNMTLDFVSRFVDGREPINGFLHRIPEIKIRMSEGAFKTMQNRDDAYNFFRSAVKYYDAGAMKYAEKIANEIMKLPTEMKRLISSTKLSGIVTLPLQMLFSFDDVDMSSTTTFNISKEDISTVNKFIRGIYSQYASPEKEKQKIISDLQNVVYHLKESCDLGENKAAVSAITEGVSNWYSGKYQSQLEKYRAEFEYENVDFEAMKNANHELQMMYESTKMKKLKKIPRDLVAYITIETESIRDANDKMMIASYCLAKLEIVEWYIELLEVGSKKYIVPHSKPYLEGIRRQLLQCYDNIMKVKIVRPNERPLIDIKYPAGYEG